MPQTKKTDFSQGSVRKLIMAQALPLTMAQLVQLLYNIVDRIYIGHLEDVGDLALTGLGITFPVIVIIAAFTNLYGSGGATLFSLARGKGDIEEAQGLLGNVFSLLVGTSAVLFGLCFCFAINVGQAAIGQDVAPTECIITNRSNRIGNKDFG